MSASAAEDPVVRITLEVGVSDVEHAADVLGAVVVTAEERSERLIQVTLEPLQGGS